MRLTAWAAVALLIGACGAPPDHDDGPRPVAAPATSASPIRPVFASPSGYFATSSCENPW